MFKRLANKRIILIILALIILAVGCSGIYYFYKKHLQVKENPRIIAVTETDELVKEVGKIMELPADETPTIATVMDKEKVKDQPFFTKAENGDKLLAYTKNQKAILYRPSTRKIIEVAPIYLNNAQ